MKIWLKLDCIDYSSVEIKDGKELLYKEECFAGRVPEFIPGSSGSNHIELLIDADSGRIINWQTCSDMIRKFIEEQKQNK